MSTITDDFMGLNIYEEEINDETTLDLSSQQLTDVPEINNNWISVLYLQNNSLNNLPDDFFLSLPRLKWLDLRENQLTDIPKIIKNHQCLTHLLLQGNKITSLPNELGTVNLKVLSLSGNPLMYPPRDVINAGTQKILSFLHEKFIEEMFEESRSVVSDKTNGNYDCLDKLYVPEARSYNSVLDGENIQLQRTLSVQFSERDNEESDEECYSKTKGKCPKLPKSRAKILSPHSQSSKYLKDLEACPRKDQEEKMRRSFLKDMAVKRQKELIARTEKVLQGRKNIELLKNWRRNYRNRQLTFENDTYKLTPKSYPYDTSPEYMTLLSREDIEKDLPDKYRKKLVRRSKPTIPRKSKNDVHLAMKIKQLFENLEAIDLNREAMSPRTEQKVLLGEIQKISEIKQKLMELSTSNTRSVAVD